MFTEKDILLLGEAIGRWGCEAQKKQTIEECSELITAILHRDRDKCTNDDVITEVADVIIMCEQMKLIYGSEQVENEVRRKMKRLEERLS